MPFLQNSSNIVISGGHFNNVAHDATIYHVNQAPLTRISTDENNDHLVDAVLDETVQLPKVDDQPGTKTTSPPAGAKGWVRYVHPEGWIYFSKKHDYELEDIQCHEIRGALEGEIMPSTIQDTFASTSAASHKPLRELKGSRIPVALGFGGLQVKTYVDHRRWYASEDKVLLFNQEPTDEASNELQLNYWTFMHDYPAHHALPSGAVTAARQALTCYVMEGLVRKSGTRAPFTLAESKALLKYFDVIEKNNNEENVEQPPATAQLPLQSPMRTILVAFVLLNVAKHRQNSRYGHNTFEEALKAESLEEPSVMFMLVSSICLFAPLDHRIHIYAAKRSSELRGDIETWPAYIDSLVREWSTFNLAATVMLSASVGFLSIPGVDSVTRIIVLLSVVLTLGSIITGVYLLWRHQGGGGRLEYSISLIQSGLNINLLAIILSTPFTFLVWGVVTFLVAVISYSFLGFQSTIQGSDVLIRGKAFILVSVLSAVVLMAMLISFAFFRSFRKHRVRPMYV